MQPNKRLLAARKASAAPDRRGADLKARGTGDTLQSAAEVRKRKGHVEKDVLAPATVQKGFLALTGHFWAGQCAETHRKKGYFSMAHSRLYQREHPIARVNRSQVDEIRLIS